VSTVTLNDARVAIAHITIPYYGTWSADVTLPVDAEIVSPCKLVAGDLTLTGTVVRQAAFNGDRKARIVGGANGWSKVLPAKGYSHVVGVKLSSVLKDAASETGETITLDSDRNVGLLFARDEGQGEALLHSLLGGRWYVDGEGITQTRARASSPIVTPFNLITRSGSMGVVEVATENIAAWVPGRTFSSNTVTTPQTISSVTIDADNDGKVRLHIMSADADNKERLRTALKSLIKSELSSLLYAGVWEYTVAPSLGMPGIAKTIDCTPTDSRMPSLTNVPLVGMGDVTPTLAGTKCRIQFVNCDPSRPECVSLGGTTEHLMTTEACALLIYNTLVTLMAAAGGGPLLAVVLQPLLGLAITGALAAQAAPAPPGLIPQTATAAALQAGFATGVVPSSAIFAGWAASIAALQTKTLDVSGQFPSIGVPSGSQ